MSHLISVMTLGEIFDRTFKTLGKTFVRNIIISLIMNLPPFILFFIGGQLAITTATDMVAQWEYATPQFADVVQLLVFPMLLFGLGALAATIAYTWSFIAIYIVVGHHMNDETISWQDAISRAGSKVLPGIGFAILMGLAIFAIIIVPYIVLIIGIASETGAIAFLGGLMMFAVMFVVVYLSTRWVFGLTVIAWEDSGVIAAFTRSAEIVKNKWWRTFGILLLLGIVASFAISLISSPVFIIGFIGPYINFLQTVVNEVKPGPAEVVSLVSGMFYGYVASIALTVILSTVIEPIYTMMVYFDNRARNGEFDEQEPPAPTGPDNPDDNMQLGDNWQNVSV